MNITSVALPTMLNEIRSLNPAAAGVGVARPEDVTNALEGRTVDVPSVVRASAAPTPTPTITPATPPKANHPSSRRTN